MKRVTVFALALLAIGYGCGKSTPSSPSGPTGSTSTTTFNVPLSPAAEVPPIANAESTASGNATIKLNLTKDGSGNVIAATADFTVTGNNFQPSTTITLAHIHPGAVGVNGGIVVNTGLSSGQAPVSNGSMSFTKNEIPVSPDLAQSILANPANYYFNVHTAANPSGVMRGQLNGVTGVGGNDAPQDPGNGY
jgi:hypothetical protein